MRESSSDLRQATGSRRKRRPSVRTACPRPRLPRRSRQPDRSDGTKSATAIDLNRVAAAATSRTEPRTTVPGQATLRPLARRS